MIYGIGTDIVNIDRVSNILNKNRDGFIKRVLTEHEIALFSNKADNAAYCAKRFAAKEAAAKALGTGIGRGVSWQHMQIENDDNGAPVLVLTGPAAERQAQLGSRQVHISIADETDRAIAFVVLS